MRPFELFRKRILKDKTKQLESFKSKKVSSSNHSQPGRYQEEDDTFMFI